MLDLQSTNLSGLLLEWPGQKFAREDLLRAKGLHFIRDFYRHWEQYNFVSQEPLTDEDRATSGPYDHPLIARRSGSRILLLSTHRNVVEHLVDKHLVEVLRPHLRMLPIAIDQLVKGVTHNPGSYALSFAHARVPAFGAVLRAMSFYGDDLGQASLFRNQLDLMVFFTCGLKEAKGGYEIVRLGADGSISFFLPTPARVLEVEQVLRFLRNSSYLPADLLNQE